MTEKSADSLAVSPELKQKYQEGVVSLELSFLGLMREDKGGHGFIIGADTSSKTCEIGTDLHVVENWYELPRVRLADGKEHHATVAYKDPSHDLAILTVSGVENLEQTCKAMTLADEDHQAESGQNVYLGKAPKQHHNSFPEFRKPEQVGTVAETIPLSDAFEDIGNQDPSRNIIAIDSLATIHGDSGLPLMSIESGQVQAVLDMGHYGIDYSFATPAYLLKNDQDKLHQQQCVVREIQESIKAAQTFISD